MQKLYVYADFDWLSTAVLVEKLNYETVQVVSGWKTIAAKLGIPKRELALFETRIGNKSLP